jgi:protein TonB
MLRNSLIVSTVIHVILLIALSFTTPADPVSRKTPLFLELYGDTSGTEAGSSGTVAVDAGKQMKQSGVSPKKKVALSKVGKSPPAGLAAVQNLPKTVSVSELKGNADIPHTNSASKPGGSIEKDSNTATTIQNPDSNGVNGMNDVGADNGNGSDDAGDTKGDGDDDAGSKGPANDNAGGMDSGSRRGLLLYAPQPEYPAQARRNNWEGAALLELRIGPEGTVREATVLQSSGYSLLDRTAEKTVKSWRYRPACRDGVAVAWQTQVRIKFVLKD